MQDLNDQKAQTCMAPSVMVVEVHKTSVTHQPKISIYQVKALSPVEIYICHSVKLFIVWTIEASEG